MDKLPVITHLFTEIAGPLIILLALLLLYFPLRNWLKNKGLLSSGKKRIDFRREVSSVHSRAMNILPNIGPGTKMENSGLDPEKAVTEAWFAVEAAVRNLGENYCLVDPANEPYPWDYVLFELEMKKRIRNSTLGIYRDLDRLYELSQRDDVPVDEESARMFVMLASQVASSLDETSGSGESELF